MYHYNTPDSIWKRIDKTGGPDVCWPWLGARLKKMGYGQTHWRGRTVYAHRMVYELTYGKIPDGLNVLHKCDNPSCCNPSHLFLGTNTDNVVDKMVKGRMSQSKLTKEQAEMIRTRYLAGGITQRELAKEFAIDQAIISGIVQGKRWKHY